jgi:hypothetical protein
MITVTKKLYAMMIDTEASRAFGGEAVNTAIYLYQRYPKQ